MVLRKGWWDVFEAQFSKLFWHMFNYIIHGKICEVCLAHRKLFFSNTLFLFHNPTTTSFHPHQLDELVVADLAVPVQIRSLQQLGHILLAHVLSQLLQPQPQFFLSDQPVSVLVEEFENSEHIS